MMDYIRKNGLAVALTAAISSFGTYVGKPYIDNALSIHAADVNRLAELRLEDYRKLTAEQATFHELLQSYTAQLIDKDQADSGEKSKMIASLVRQYDDVKQFRIYVDPKFHAPLTEYQSSLNDLRRQLDRTNSKAELNDFYIVFRRNLELAKTVSPIIENAVGKPRLNQASL